MTQKNQHGRRRGRGLRPWLIQAKVLGLMVLLGGLAALVSIGALGEDPTTLGEWRLLRAVVKSVFWPCVFGGLVLVIVAGIVLWLQHPMVFLRMRWFRVKAVLLACALPGLHLFARSRIHAWDDALEAGDLDGIALAWADSVTAFVIALVVLFSIAVIGRVKPRFGEAVGKRRT